MTLHELSAAVSARRGKPTARTTCTQPLNDLWAAGRAFKTRRSRPGTAGVRCHVWVHRRHWTPDMGDAKAEGEA